MPAKTDIYSHRIMSADSEKRERIIKAAMLEFKKGFKYASTDIMVKEAGISKGLLFHYFGTKEGLWDFTVWYAFEVMTAEYFDLINAGQPDLLERLWQITLLRTDLSYKYPFIFEFLSAAYAESGSEDEFRTLYKAMREYETAGIFSKFNISLFKTGINVKKAVDIIQWTLSGYEESRSRKQIKPKDYKPEYDLYLKEIKAYFDIFRNVFYSD